METSVKNAILTLAGFIITCMAGAQNKYNDHGSMVRKINALSREYPALCTVRSPGKSAGGRDIMLITIGKGDIDNKPGIAVIGGLEGSCMAGREITAGFAEYILKGSGSPEISNILDKITFYIMPDVNPDATDQFFQGLRYERKVNSGPTDDDRDFLIDEDPYEDLNNDGIITLIRVADPEGRYVISREDSRIMVEADLSKGEIGAYLVYSEGIDNDKDGLFNEDGPGGVNFNRNLTFNYEEFGLNAGLHPVSEPESKTVLDFLFDHFNIYATFAFGPQDNLNQITRPGADHGSYVKEQLQSPSAGSSPGRSSGSSSVQAQTLTMPRNSRIISVMKQDELINKLVSDKYREITGVKGSPVSELSPGNFMEWAYYHYGRYSYSTPAWWIPREKDKNPDAEFLKFAGENNIKDVFVEWKEIKHPDFPGKKVEVGGIKPFAAINPPPDQLDDIINKNCRFIIESVKMHPELEFLDLKTEDQGGNIFRLSLKVHNKGIFATAPAVAERNIWTRLMRINIETGGNQKLLSGKHVQNIERLEGGESVEFSWLIMGKGPVKVTAGAVNTGIINISAVLK